MDKTLEQKRLELLEDTCSHFNSFNRSEGEHTCKYLPLTTQSEGCAIGRLIADKELCKKLDALPNPSVSDKETFGLLPDELKELGGDFLTALQRLHDNKRNWRTEGLSSLGLERKEYLTRVYCK